MVIAYLLKGRVLTWRGRRVHHGLTGCVLTAIGLALMVDDALDCKRWLADFRRPRYRT